METFYLFLVIFIFILAIFDLNVGVSNDASNFLNSAIGSKAASFRTSMIVAAIGIFVGAALSNGMMDVARHGIFQPQFFYFEEIMFILLAVMLTDVVLLDVFNSLGMPTSTTVSLVFELLGATVAVSMMKVYHSAGELNFVDLLNTDKAFTMILAIFMSVAIAFFFGALVQYISRLIFTFNYRKPLKYFGGIFGGIATTSIIYFMLIKGLKGSSFMTPELKALIDNYTGILLLGSFVFFSVVMQILTWLKVNVLKVVVLLGTFALALAFAGNDLVNFLGVPLVGYSSLIDMKAAGGAPDTFLMSSLLESAKTPWYFLVGAGVIMVTALFTSKKAHNVIKTSVDLASQGQGNENFGTSPVARILVRKASNMSAFLLSITPASTKNWIDSRFNSNEIILENKASFDLVRASVNVVLSGLLIAVGTSFKLPLSTTYVAFMVAMGSSLADRAWGRESAVYRITGVLSVIGGWFITAGAAFTIAFVVALLIYWGGIPAMVAMVALAAYLLIRSQMAYRKRMKKEALKEEVNETVAQLSQTTNSREALALFRKHSREENQALLRFAADMLNKSIGGITEWNLKELRTAITELEEKKTHLKQIKRVGNLGVTQIENDIAVDKGLYYYQGNDFASEVVYSILRFTRPSKEHIDNNFNPLSEEEAQDLHEFLPHIVSFLHKGANMIHDREYFNLTSLVSEANTLDNQLTQYKRGELKRIQQEGNTTSTKTSLLYLNILHELQNVLMFTKNLLKVSRKFQME
ncbi:phosphate/sulfate permease [Parabacteroides sp. PFB2-12]|uniref:inorganic phosphate transporter n=1 Tax=unclassified Parabacteroides TaxID=2649774 RepID=UPI002473BAB7|nr:MULTISPECIES: inorganic phosphate transporter [unclassified Parabacteroides]MDH6343083.1 phosphate/sulfate permease [Parabacteroides sp. PM6-13]MDH6390728.1 phosphate/sulfate permease [Parabacteroides sp. PFB2-12]